MTPLTPLYNLKYNFSFEVYGVKTSVTSNRKKIINFLCKNIEEIFPMGVQLESVGTADLNFEIVFGRNSENSVSIDLRKNGEQIDTAQTKFNFDQLISELRLSVAEYANDFVFIHGGAVAYRGLGIIIPGKSFSGKTTLVSELIRLGMEYYSDEYAVLDGGGKLLPYTKTLSMRGIIDDYTQKEIAAEKYGAVKGTSAIEVKFILISRFQKDSKNNIKQISAGQGIIELLANSISIRRNPRVVVPVIGNIANNSVIVKTKRGEAAEFAFKFKNFIDQHLSTFKGKEVI